MGAFEPSPGYFESVKILLRNSILVSVLNLLKSPCEPTRRGTRPETQSGGKRAREQPMASDRKAKSHRRKARTRPLEKPQFQRWYQNNIAASLKATSGAWGDQDSVRPPDEDAIWQSEVRLKGAGGGHTTRSAVSPTREIEAVLKSFQKVGGRMTRSAVSPTREKDAVLKSFQKIVLISYALTACGILPPQWHPLGWKHYIRLKIITLHPILGSSYAAISSFLKHSDHMQLQ